MGQTKPVEVSDGESAPQEAARAVPVSDVLRESEERYRALAEHAQDVISEISADGRYLYVSPSYAEMFGWEPVEVLGRSIFELLHPDDVDRVARIFHAAVAAREPADALYRLRHKDGSWIWAESTGRPYAAADEQLHGVIVSRDVTDRVLAEQAAHEQREVERRIAGLTRRFLNVMPEDFEACVRSGLEVAGEIAGADRAKFFIHDPDGSGLSGYYHWHAPSVAPPLMLDVPNVQRSYPWSLRRLLAGEILHVPCVADLPDEAAPEREGLLAQGVRSYLAVPIRVDGPVVGMIDFFRCEKRAWTSVEITRLGMIADVLSGAVRRLGADRSRRQAEERFRTLTRHAHDAICEVTLDGRLLYITGNYEHLSGYTEAELEDRSPWSLLHPDEHDRFRRFYTNPSVEEPITITFRVLHRDGGVRWLEATVKRFTRAPGDTRLAVVVRDVTDREVHRIELERQLEVERRLAEFSRRLLEADLIDDGIERGLESAAALAGAERAFLISSMGGDGARAAVYDWHAEHVRPREHPVGRSFDRRRWVVSQLERGEPVRIPRVAELPEEAGEIGEQLQRFGVVSYLCLPIVAEGVLQGVVGFHCMRPREWTDAEVTLLQLVVDLFTSALRRKRAEVRLEESQHRLLQAQKMEAVGTLAGGIAHDFNNQLTVMLANARFAIREAEGDEDVRLALHDLNRAAEHCAQLTRSLLAFSRRTAAQPQTLRVGEVVEEARELLRPLIPSSIRLEVRTRNPDSQILVDPTQLQQVLVNLVVNARDAMPEGGRLVLEASSRLVEPGEARRMGLTAPGSYVELMVRDTGSGMEEQVRARIFEPFFTTKPVGKGSGLGLATAYGIVEQCGGAIVVESEVGRGSTFRVLLPRTRESPEVESLATAAEARPGAGTVLLVEDEQSVRRLVGRMLRGAGYEVIEAADGAEALRVGRQNVSRLAAVVTDVDMPRMSGIELARRLARQRPELPVLFISGLSQEGLEGEGPSRNMRFVAKPFTERILIENLTELLSEA